jgi:energy-coupling factor transport system substrate-specific component
VTWQIASFAVLFAALAAGFGWYERTHPSAKVLALVRTLAALAAWAAWPSRRCRTSSRRS